MGKCCLSLRQLISMQNGRVFGALGIFRACGASKLVDKQSKPRQVGCNCILGGGDAARGRNAFVH